MINNIENQNKIQQLYQQQHLERNYLSTLGIKSFNNVRKVQKYKNQQIIVQQNKNKIGSALCRLQFQNSDGCVIHCSSRKKAYFLRIASSQAGTIDNIPTKSRNKTKDMLVHRRQQLKNKSKLKIVRLKTQKLSVQTSSLQQQQKINNSFLHYEIRRITQGIKKMKQQSQSTKNNNIKCIIKNNPYVYPYSYPSPYLSPYSYSYSKSKQPSINQSHKLTQTKSSFLSKKHITPPHSHPHPHPKNTTQSSSNNKYFYQDYPTSNQQNTSQFILNQTQSKLKSNNNNYNKLNKQKQYKNNLKLNPKILKKNKQLDFTPLIKIQSLYPIKQILNNKIITISNRSQSKDKYYNHYNQHFRTIKNKCKIVTHFQDVRSKQSNEKVRNNINNIHINININHNTNNNHNTNLHINPLTGWNNYSDSQFLL